MPKRRKALIKWAILVILLPLVFGFGTFGRTVLLMLIVLCGARALYAVFELVAGQIDERRQDRLQAEFDRHASTDPRTAEKLTAARTRSRSAGPPALLALVATVAACTQSGPETGESGPGLDSRPWAAGPNVDATLEAASGDDVQLSWGNAVAVDSDGRVFLRDGLTKGVLVLTPDLRYERTIGREGEGPGEFMHVAGVQLLPGDTLIVYDSQLLRVTIYPPASDEPASEHDVSAGLSNDREGAWYPRTVHKLPGQSGFLAAYSRPVMADGSDADRQYDWNVVRRLHQDSTGRMQTDSVFAYPRGDRLVLRQGDSRGGAVTLRAHPFGRSPFLELVGDDAFAYADTRTVGAQVVDVTGRVVSSFGYEATSIPVTRDEMSEASRDMPRAMVRMLRASAPYSWPSVTGLVVDDQRQLWLGIRKSDRTQLEWAAFTSDGTHVASVLLPSGFQLMSVQGSRMIGVHVDDSDVPQVQAYRMQPAAKPDNERPSSGGSAQAMVDQAGSDRALEPRPWASGPWLAPVMEAASREDVQLSRVDGLDIASDGRVYAADALTNGVVVASGSDVGERRYDVLRHLYEDDGVQHADSLFGAPSGETLVVRVGARDGGVVHVTVHPFGRRSYWQLLGGDRFVHGHSQEVGAQVVDLDGRVVSAFSYAATPVPVEDAELGAATDGMEPEMAQTLRREGPYNWPPVAALATDDMGRIWLAIRGEDRSVLEWAAFRQDGTHEASVLFPARFRLLAVRAGRLVGVHRDDYDVPQIRAYRLEATE